MPPLNRSVVWVRIVVAPDRFSTRFWCNSSCFQCPLPFVNTRRPHPDRTPERRRPYCSLLCLSASGDFPISSLAAWRRSSQRHAPPSPSTPAQLHDKIGDLLREIDSATNSPTAAQREWVDRFEEALNALLSEIDTAANTELDELNQRLQRQGFEPVDDGPRNQ